ncbi:DsbA family protein [Microbacterium indicum]|uniref:DsbA family protein n=1 Tax=Microbacterium indicum TaxID=358100 RepID=UPI0004016912|nr:thioredoxin domain-containing protein [Microbacterium indicum]
MAQAKKSNLFAIIISIVVVVAVVGVGALVIVLNNRASAPATAPGATSVNQETGAIVIGDGAQELDTYVDFICPICGQFEDTWGDQINDAVENGDITLNVHPVGLLDNASQGTEYSSRAANAMYCVANTSPDAAYAFLKEMYDQQPSEGTTGLDDDQIIQIAEDSGAGDVADCITNREYDDYVQQQTDDMPIAPGQTRAATPSVLLDDEWIQDWNSTTLASHLAG